jgi:hypothetical protein
VQPRDTPLDKQISFVQAANVFYEAPLTPGQTFKSIKPELYPSFNIVPEKHKKWQHMKIEDQNIIKNPRNKDGQCVTQNKKLTKNLHTFNLQFSVISTARTVSESWINWWRRCDS